MKINIIDKQIKQYYDNIRYYLELTLSEDTDYIWQQSFNEALTTNMYTSMRGSGAPVVTKIEIVDNKITTPPFSEYAQSDLPEFIKELEHFIEIANKIYITKQVKIQQQQNREEKEQQERIKKLEEMNRKLNS